jgi:dihydrofolate reductase
MSARKLTVFDRISPEGLFASVDGGLDWIVPEPEVDRAGAAAIPATDTVLFGRRTYEQFASFWPLVLENPAMARDPHDPSRQSPELLAFAKGLTAMTKIVYSRTLARPTWANSRVEPAFDPAAVRALKQQPGKDIIVFGSATLVAALTEHGLVDEYTLVVNPVLLGRGQPLFREVPKRTPLTLLEAKPYPNGTVVLRYAPKRP